MQKLLPALLAIFLLIGCTQVSVETNKVATKNQTIDNLEKNLECLKLREKVETRVKESRGDIYTVESIFYSPKQDSCVYIVNYYYSKLSNGEFYDSSQWWIIDFFTGQELEFINLEKDRTKLNEKITEYQN